MTQQPFSASEALPSTGSQDSRPQSLTYMMSTVSDRLCESLVERSARKYSEVLRTPSYFLEMLLLVEDRRFAIHFGIDPIAIVRALIFDIRGGVLQGASTIGQQVYSIRQSRRGKRSRTLSYKLKQIAWAMSASTFTSRIHLLTEYLDGVYWGRSYLGLDSATEGYFKKRRGELSAAESFFLAERIATPNRVSVPRISNLLSRRPIVRILHNRGARIRDVIATYEKIYHCGGQTWELLEK